MSEHNQVKMVEMNYDKDRPAADNPVKVQDLSLRDGHQSLFATSMYCSTRHRAACCQIW